MGCAGSCCRGSGAEQPQSGGAGGQSAPSAPEPRRDLARDEERVAVAVVKEESPRDDVEKKQSVYSLLSSDVAAPVGSQTTPGHDDQAPEAGRGVETVTSVDDFGQGALLGEQPGGGGQGHDVTAEQDVDGSAVEEYDPNEAVRLLALMEEEHAKAQVAEQAMADENRRKQEEIEENERNVKSAALDAEAAEASALERDEEEERQRSLDKEAAEAAAATAAAALEAHLTSEGVKEEEDRREEEEEESEKDINFLRVASGPGNKITSAAGSNPSSRLQTPAESGAVEGAAALVLASCVDSAAEAAASILKNGEREERGDDEEKVEEEDNDLLGCWSTLGTKSRRKSLAEQQEALQQDEVAVRALIRRRSSLMLDTESEGLSSLAASPVKGLSSGQVTRGDAVVYEKVTVSNMIDWAKDLVVESISKSVAPNPNAPHRLHHGPGADGVWRSADRYAMLTRMTLLRTALFVSASLRSAIPAAASLCTMAPVPRKMMSERASERPLAVATAEHRPLQRRAVTVARGPATAAVARKAVVMPSWAYNPQAAVEHRHLPADDDDRDQRQRQHQPTGNMTYFIPKQAEGFGSMRYSSSSAAVSGGAGRGRVEGVGGGGGGGGGKDRVRRLEASGGWRMSGGAADPKVVDGVEKAGWRGKGAWEGVRGEGRVGVQYIGTGVMEVLALGGKRSKVAAEKLMVMPAKVQSTRGRSANLLKRMMIN